MIGKDEIMLKNGLVIKHDGIGTLRGRHPDNAINFPDEVFLIYLDDYVWIKYTWYGFSGRAIRRKLKRVCKLTDIWAD